MEKNVSKIVGVIVRFVRTGGDNGKAAYYVTHFFKISFPLGFWELAPKNVSLRDRSFHCPIFPF
jgi:hypothetical protein